MNLFKMKCHLLGLVLLILSGKPLSGQSTTLFDDTKVASIYLELPADSLSYILNNLEHNRYLDTLTRFITNPDTIFSRIDALESLISAAAWSDPYRSLDYGYTFASFQNGFDQTIDGHTPYGIKPFLGIRFDSIRSQIAGLLSGTEAVDSQNADFRIYPNPSSELLFIQSASINFSERVVASIYGICGQKSSEFQWEASEAAYAIPVSSLPSGAYVLHLRSEKKEARFVFLKGD